MMDPFSLHHRVNWPEETKNHWLTTDPGAPAARYQLIKVNLKNLCFSSSASPISLIFLPFDLKVNIFERPVGIIRTRRFSEKLMSPRDSAYLIYYKKQFWTLK